MDDPGLTKTVDWQPGDSALLWLELCDLESGARLLLTHSPMEWCGTRLWADQEGYRFAVQDDTVSSYLDGEERREGKLQIGTVWQLGEKRLEVVASTTQPATLTGCTEPYRGISWLLLGQTNLIGRSGKRVNQVLLEEPSVSREQAQIFSDAGDFWLEPQAPCLVNGQRAQGRVRLNQGDLLQFGALLLRFALPRPVSARSQEPIRIYSLGRFQVIRGGNAVLDAAWRSPLARHLLAYLVSQWPRPVPLEILLEIFWPEREPQVALNNLKAILSTLRKILSTDGQADPFVRTRDSLQWMPDQPIWSDVEEIRELLAICRQKDGDQRLLLRQAAELYQGVYLPECNLEFAQKIRQQLQGEMLDLLFQAMAWPGTADETLYWTKKILQLDPCCQLAALRRMEAYCQLGEAGKALECFKACEQALKLHFSCTPNLELQRQYQLARLQL